MKFGLVFSLLALGISYVSCSRSPVVIGKLIIGHQTMIADGLKSPEITCLKIFDQFRKRDCHSGGLPT